MLKHLRVRTPLLLAALIVWLGIFASGTWGLYARWEHFDTALHALGGLAAAWFGLALLQDELTHLAFWKQLLVFVSFATLAGVLWEFAEYQANFLRETAPWLWYWFHGGDLADTVTDLSADILGALAFSLWALQAEGASSPPRRSP